MFRICKEKFYIGPIAIFRRSPVEFFASIFAANEVDKLVSAILAAIPGASILINNSLRYEERTKWFWKKVRITEKLLRKIRDSDSSGCEEISDLYSEKMEELELEWPAMDSPAKQPKK